MKKSVSRINSLIIIFVLLLFSVSKVSGAVDSRYIHKYTTDLSVRTYVSEKFTWLDYYSKQSDKTYSYKPNNPLNLGAGFSWRGITINGSYGLSFLNNNDYGHTDSADYQVNYYKGRFAMGFIGQRYKGFYLKANGDTELRPDIELLNLGGYISYLFGGDKFSYRAAFNQSEKQIHSAGSFQAGIEVYYSKINADKSLAPEGPDETYKIESTQFGPNCGYAYSWVLPKGFYTTLAVSIGANIDFSRTNNEEQTIKVSPSIFPRFAAGYDSESWGIVLSHIQNFKFITNTGDGNTNLGIGTLKLTYTKRFKL